MGQAGNKQVALIIAKENFRDEELSVPQAIFTKAGCRVVIFSSSLGTATGMSGAQVEIDKTISQLTVGDYAAIVFIGGSGASQYWGNNRVQQIVRQAAAEDKILGAICIAPVILARAGVLKGKQATVWPSEKQQLIKNGVIYQDKPVVVAGRIITANGPASAEQFAQAILGLM